MILYHRPLVIFLMGPTASGKTSLAIALKKENAKINIISVDSALVYRGMDIGTSKPFPSELKIAPHKLIDIRDPSECYSVADFYRDANREIEYIVKSGCIPLLVGGTMLYYKILLTGLFCLPTSNKDIRDNLLREACQNGWSRIYNRLQYIDPVSASKIHCNDHKRIIRALEIFYVSGKTRTELQCSIKDAQSKYRILQFAVIPSSQEILKKRIEQRFYRMLDMGFEHEVNILYSRDDLHQGLKTSISCIGYRQMWEYLSGKINYNYMIYQGIYATQRFAKKQLTWLRQWPNLNWIISDHLSIAVDSILKILNK